MATLAVAFAGITSRTYASPITVPVGLPPGSDYRLVFVTAESYTAADPTIADYNSEVNADANDVSALAALGTTWLAIGSTSAVNAIDNVGQDAGVPIYNLDGQLVANDASTASGSLFSAANSGFFNAIDYNENGVTLATSVWTGTNFNGLSLGNGFALGGADPNYGDSSSKSNGIYEGNPGANTFQYSLYGISDVLEVPASSTPEPSAFGMMGVAFVAFSWRQLKHPTS